jgi:hypothetical protein
VAREKPKQHAEEQKVNPSWFFHVSSCLKNPQKDAVCKLGGNSENGWFCAVLRPCVVLLVNFVFGTRSYGEETDHATKFCSLEWAPIRPWGGKHGGNHGFSQHWLTMLGTPVGKGKAQLK